MLLGALAVLGRAGEGNVFLEDLRVAVHVFLDDADLVRAALVRLHADEHGDVTVGAIKSLEPNGLDRALGLTECRGVGKQAAKEENPRQETSHRPRNVRRQRPWDKSNVGRSL